MFRLTRFITDEGDQGMEYLLSKDVPKQWGSFFRGNFGVCFIGGDLSNKPYKYTISLMPKLGYKNRGNEEICYLPKPGEDQQGLISPSIEVTITK